MQISPKWRSRLENLLAIRSNDPEDRRRGRLLARILFIAALATILLMLTNLWYWLVGASRVDAIFVLEDLAILAAFWGAWLINRSGRIALATHLFLGIYILSAVTLLDLHELNHTLLIFSVPIALAGFLSRPGASFFYAGIVELAFLIRTALEGFPESQFTYALNFGGFIVLCMVVFVTSSSLNQATRQIKDSEEKYRGMFDNVPIGLYRTTPEGRILEANPTFLRMFGHPDIASLREVNAADLYADPADRSSHLASIIEGTTRIAEIHLRDADGRTFWAADYVRQVRGADGKVKHYEGSLIDTTSRRMAEEASHESLARLEALVGNIPQGVLFEDELRRIQFANKTFCSLFGISSVGSILGEDSTNLNDQVKGLFSDPQAFIRGLAQHLVGRKITLAEELSLADGRVFEQDYVPIVMAGKYVGSYWLYRDITERKRAEETLRHREAILEVISDASQRFLKTTDWTRDIQPILEQLGWAVRASRAYVFQNRTRADAAVLASQRFEWAAPGIAPQIENPELQDIPLVEAGFARWAETLGRNELIVGPVSEFPASEREILSPQDILSLVVVPIFDGEDWWGFIGFDDCLTERAWSLVETEALTAFASVLGATIQRRHIEQTLRESEERFRSAFDNAAIGMSLVAPDGRFLKVNHALCDIVGYPAEELLAMKFQDITHPDDLGPDLALAEQLLAGKIRAFQLEKRYIHKKGGIVWVSLSVSLMRDAFGEPAYFVTQIENITGRKRAEENVKSQVERLAALRTIDAVISASTDLNLSLNAVLDQTLIHLRVDAADILLLNSTLNTLDYAAGKGFHTRGISRSRIRVGEGYAGRAALSRNLLYIHDLGSASPPFERAQLLDGENFACYHVVPLITKGNVVGVLETFHRSAIERDHDWLDFLESLSAQAAIGIDNASLFENLQRSNMDLVMSYETTLEGWSAALDLRDKETEGHTQRVTELTQKIAARMGIRGPALANIRRGALLHDIGKMGVPDKILFKPGPLTEDEWEIMRKHPRFAYDLIHPIVYLRDALDIPYCHHEKWDGSGYPRGLKGAAIPLAARIFAAVDIYDALISDRPYRPAWTQREALDYIRDLSGTHLDPDVVKIFLREMGEE